MVKFASSVGVLVALLASAPSTDASVACSECISTHAISFVGSESLQSCGEVSRITDEVKSCFDREKCTDEGSLQALQELEASLAKLTDLCTSLGTGCSVTAMSTCVTEFTTIFASGIQNLDMPILCGSMEKLDTCFKEASCNLEDGLKAVMGESSSKQVAEMTSMCASGCNVIEFSRCQMTEYAKVLGANDTSNMPTPTQEQFCELYPKMIEIIMTCSTANKCEDLDMISTMIKESVNDKDAKCGPQAGSSDLPMDNTAFQTCMGENANEPSNEYSCEFFKKSYDCWVNSALETYGTAAEHDCNQKKEQFLCADLVCPKSQGGAIEGSPPAPELSTELEVFIKSNTDPNFKVADDMTGGASSSSHFSSGLVFLVSVLVHALMN